MNAFSELVKIEKLVHRYVIQYIHSKGLSPINIGVELDSILGEPAPLYTIIKYWVAEFKRSHTRYQDEHRSGRPDEMTMTEIVKKIYKMVLDDRRLKVRELANMLNIPKSAVHCTLTENLDMRNLCVRWVPRLLIMEQKERREDVSIECFAIKKTSIKLIFCVDS